MTASKVQLIGGHFQDAEGNLLANGYLKMTLSQDGAVSGVGNICSGIEITIQLDSSADVSTSPAQYVWGNDNIVPTPTFYKVTGYSAAGQPCWGPNNQQVAGSGTFDVGTWVPNAIISWSPSTNQPVLFEVEGTPLSSQTTVNFESTDASVTITDEGSGTINLQSSGGGTKFDTPGLGWFWGAKDYGEVSSTGANPCPGGAANAVGCVQITLESEYVISSLQAYVTTGAGSGNATCALYSANGNTKLIDAGATFIDMGTHSAWTYSVTLGSPVTLPPGVYWFAWGCTDTSGGVLAHANNPALQNLLNGLNFIDSQVGVTRVGTAANGLSAGAMPAALGAITFVDSSATNFAPPAVMFVV